MIGIILIVVITILPIMFISAKGYAEAGASVWNSGDKDKGVALYKKAVSTDPFDAEYKVNYANILIRSGDKNAFPEAEKNIQKAERLSKYNVNLLPQIASYYVSTGRVEKGLQLVDRTTELRPFNVEQWQHRVNAYYNVAMSYFKNKDNDNGLKYVDKTLALIDEAKEVNSRNLNPFIFNTGTQEMLGKVKYIKDMHGKKKVLKIDNIIFYNIPEMDIDSDGIPDQWTTSNQEGVRVYYEGGCMIAENANSIKNAYIQSRNINLNSDDEYLIEMLPGEKSETKEISFVVIGVKGATGKLIKGEKVYTGEFKTPEEFEPKNNRLRLYLNDRYAINQIAVINE